MCGGGGGGSSQPTNQTVTQVTIPPELMPYAKKLLGTAEDLTYKQPYEPYTGQQVAGLNPLQMQALQQTQQQQTASQLGQATDLAGAAGAAGGAAGQNYAQMATDPSAMQAYMSPYMSGVVEQQKLGAMRDFARQIPGMQAAGIRSGGRGGTREALLQAESNRNLQQQLGGIQATGLQSAFQNAQQAQQFGANLGLQGNAQRLSAAGALGQLGQQQFGQQQAINQAQLGAGAQLQQLEQQRLQTSYQDYLNRQRYPYQQLGFMSDLIRGTPTAGGIQSMYQQAPNAFSQVAGAGLGLAGIYGAMRPPG